MRGCDHCTRRPASAAWLALAVLLALACAGAGADIYRYQDAYGNWYFTDEPPAGVQADIIPDIKTGTTRRPSPVPAATDLAARLEAGLHAMTPVDQASLAVVVLRGPGGMGSGFFCSPDGHILTERRLLRGGGRDEPLGGHDDRTALAQEAAAVRERLVRMEKDLAGYARVLKNAEDEAARAWAQASHAELQGRYQSESEALAALELELGAQVPAPGELPFVEAGVSKLDLYLKDGTALHARVVEEDADLGLALLKLDGYRTPALRLDPDADLSEGMRVLLVGRAAGLQDAVTSAVLTDISLRRLVTDAEPLPGQGGGPVIDLSGRVIGMVLEPEQRGPSSSEAEGRAIPAILIRQRLTGACR